MCNKKIHNISHRAVDFSSFRLLFEREISVEREEEKNCEFGVLYAITTSTAVSQRI